jgi:hypothetical protein
MYKSPGKINFAISIQVETEVLNIYSTVVNVKFIQNQTVACGRKTLAKTLAKSSTESWNYKSMHVRQHRKFCVAIIIFRRCTVPRFTRSPREALDVSGTRNKQNKINPYVTNVIYIIWSTYS